MNRSRHNQKARRAGARGFSLVELMIALVVLAVLLAVALFTIGRPQAGTRLRRAASESLETMQLARARAISTGNAVIVRFTTAPGLTADVESIEVYDLASSACATPAGSATPILVEEMDPRAGEYRGIAMSRVSHGAAATGLDVCLSPTGRALDPTTGRAFSTVSGATLGGRAMIEFVTVNCDASTCTPSGLRRTVSVEYSGLADIMPPTYVLP